MGKDREVAAYTQKLRNHYKGEEILEEFQQVFGEGENQAAPGDNAGAAGGAGLLGAGPNEGPGQQRDGAARRVTFQLDAPLSQEAGG